MKEKMSQEKFDRIEQDYLELMRAVPDGMDLTNFLPKLNYELAKKLRFETLLENPKYSHLFKELCSPKEEPKNKKNAKAKEEKPKFWEVK